MAARGQPARPAGGVGDGGLRRWRAAARPRVDRDGAGAPGAQRRRRRPQAMAPRASLRRPALIVILTVATSLSTIHLPSQQCTLTSNYVYIDFYRQLYTISDYVKAIPRDASRAARRRGPSRSVLRRARADPRVGRLRPICEARGAILRGFDASELSIPRAASREFRSCWTVLTWGHLAGRLAPRLLGAKHRLYEVSCLIGGSRIYRSLAWSSNRLI